MKAGYAVLLVVLAALAGLTQKAIAGGESGIPLPTGQFSQTFQGSFALCLNPTTFAEESCSTSGVLVVPLSILTNGVVTADAAGNACLTLAEVVSDLPVNASPPTVIPNEHSVSKLLNYDSTTGTGDVSFINYTGGTCNGATFDSTGATETASGTDHLVVTDAGKRVDFLITNVTDSTGGIGDFSAFGTWLRQTSMTR